MRLYDGVVDHYEVLGVSSDVSASDLRRAFLDLARRHHPDRQSSGDASRLRSSELRMQQVNSAWQVLRDPARRAAYDAQRQRQRRSSSGGEAAGSVGSTGGGRAGPRIERPSSTFSPYWEHDEDDDDTWRYEPDELDPETAPNRALLAAPAAFFLLGLALLAASAPTGLRALFAIGLICLVLSALVFVGAPVVAMFTSQIVEERRRRRRRPRRAG